MSQHPRPNEAPETPVPFADLARLAALASGAPVACLSLPDGQCWWYGDVPLEAAEECAALLARETLEGRDLFLVPDLLLEPDFAPEARLAGTAAGAAVRFFAGVPIRTTGTSGDGILYVLDALPRTLSSEQAEGLRALARQAEALLRLPQTERAAADGRRAEEALRTVIARTRCIPWSAVVEQRGEEFHWEIQVSDEAAALRVLPLDLEPGRSYAASWHWSKAPEDRERMGALSRAALKEGRAGYSQEFRCRTRDGEQRWFWEDARIEYLAPGCWRVTGIATDITERKRMEERLVYKRGLLRTVIDSLPDYIYVKDAQSRFVLNNRAHLEALGARRPEDVLGKTDFDFFPEEFAARYFADEQQIIASGQPMVNYQQPRVDSNGRRRWVCATKMPWYDEQGNILGILGISRDITGEKLEAEAIDEARDRAVEGRRAQHAFLSTMSHELRTPLNAIIGYSEMLLEEAEDLDRKDWGADLRKIQAAGKQLLALINDILDLSEIEAGKIDLHPETFTVQEVVEAVRVAALHLAAENQNTLEVRCAPELGRMRADLPRLRQCILNLMSNACKFTQGGRVTLEAIRETGGDGEHLLFRVHDTGIGMTAEQVGSIFQEFSQADSSAARRYGGTGLGLAITRRFCRMMGGDITARSEPGAGSTFTIRLPAGVRVENSQTAETGTRPLAGATG